MDNLRNVIEILFCKRDVTEVLRTFNNPVASPCEKVVEKKTFKELWQSLNRIYSGDQLNSLYSVVTESWASRNGSQNLFNILDVAAEEMLALKGDEPICKYEQYLRWHELTALVGEDIVVCKYLASAAFSQNIVFNSFTWKPVLTTNNHRLEQIFQKGLSDLHYHFRGSSLIFDISWLSLMNEPALYNGDDFKSLPTSEPIKAYTTLAALLRLYLFASVNDYEGIISQVKTLLDFWLKSLESFEDLCVKENEINTSISVAKDLYGHRFSEDIIDYAIPDKLAEKDNGRKSNILLVGERKLLYDCFLSILSHSEPCSAFGSYLYLYLLLKSKFRNCIIQQNQRIGFENFKDFESNKMRFVNRNPLYKGLVDFAAANVTLDNQHIDYIEYRIPPKETKEELLASIMEVEKNIDDSRFKNDMGKSSVKYGYIIHFIKNADDKECFDGGKASETICRNEALREKLDRETDAVAKVVQEQENNIIGIDAANSEFYCRAEVYAQSYRKLRNLHHDSSRDYLVKENFRSLGFTYHVGEDFYDVTDGLRAIEEAILFLELTIGDRLGHAIAMGIDVQRYYDEKHFTTISPRQNLVDNLAWLLHKAEELGLLNLPVTYFLKEKFDEECLHVYGETIHLNTYIQGWMLRGDSPECYRTLDEKPSDTLNQFLLRKDAEIARNNIDARRLMHRYHFDSIVKHNGKQSVEFKIEKQYRRSFAQLLTEIQQNLQSVVANKKIAIETNLTSNRRICNIDKYSSHPIIRFYNEGLEFNDKQVNSRQQIMVSINTDDQGIFSTSLEKEYTLMALAMEKWVDSDGSPVVKEHSVYRWLENISENSISQRFKQ